MTAVRSKFAIAMAAAVCAAAASLWASRSAGDHTEPATAAPVQPPAPQPSVSAPAIGEVVQEPAAAAPGTPATAGAALTFPDGSKRPTLNAVPTDLTLDWPAGRPYSPVVDVVTNGNGVAFYRHEDGSFSTTLTRVESVSGKTVHMASTYTPGPTPSELRLRN